MSANEIITYLDLSLWVKIIIERPQVLYVLNFTGIETQQKWRHPTEVLLEFI